MRQGPQIVVAGGGFAGLWAAIGADAALEQLGAEGSIALVNRDPWLTIRPRLYEQAPKDLRVPLDGVLDELGIQLIVARVTGIDPSSRVVQLDAGRNELSYAALVLATGSRLVRAPADHTVACLYNADTPVNAARLWKRLALASAAAAAPTVVVIGGGLTGIELATEIATKVDCARVCLLDAAPELAASYEPAARTEINAALQQLGVDIHSGVRIAELQEGAVLLDGGGKLNADIIVWSAGLEATPTALPQALPRDQLGRIVVGPDLAVDGYEGLYAAGDAAAVPLGENRSAPMSCQMAIPTGKAAGRNAVAHLFETPKEAFAYDGYVTCLDLGGVGAVFTTGWERRLELSGVEGKKRKQLINHRLIYPPRGRTQLLTAGNRPAAAAEHIESAAARE